MGTKNHPGEYDCYVKAEPDEPMFVLLARDATAPQLVEMWATLRERHGEEAGVVAEARECAASMREWRDHNRAPAGQPDELTVLRDVVARVCSDIADSRVDVIDGRAAVTLSPETIVRLARWMPGE